MGELVEFMLDIKDVGLGGLVLVVYGFSKVEIIC